jgi:hypothetical protein
MHDGGKTKTPCRTVLDVSLFNIDPSGLHNKGFYNERYNTDKHDSRSPLN